MNEIYIPKVGDILIVKGTAWLSRAIQYFMVIYKTLRGFKVDFIPNHCATVIDFYGVLMVAEANAKGIEARYNIEDYLTKYKIRVKRIKGREVTTDWSSTAAAFFARPHRYDIFNFVFQIILIYTGYWIGPKKSKSTRKLYCSEYIALLLDIAYNIFNGHTWDKNPIDIEIHPELETVFQNF